MRLFGLIGKTLEHSFSKKYFTEFFSEEKLEDYSYENFEITELEKGIPLLKNRPGLIGLNVTIPYKMAILSFLDSLHSECRAIGACNCIAVKQGQWIGYNTDVTGFEKTFVPHLKPHHKGAMILGSGGASEAVAFILNKLGIPFVIVSRSNTDGIHRFRYEDINRDMMHTCPVIINTTPLGMYPNIHAAPDIPYQFAHSGNYFYDLIYNPVKTLFLQRGEQMGASIENGSRMLIIQAQESWKIWNSY